MRQVVFTILENRPVAAGTYRLRFAGDTGAFTAPGQFLDLRLPGFFLRRPISVSDWDENSATVLYKVAGEGTDMLSAMGPGTELDALTGLGNGFDVSLGGARPLLAGGGIGAAPLVRLAQDLLNCGSKPLVILGFNRAEEMICSETFAALGADVIVTTADGSFGIRGLVPDGVRQAGAYSFVYACGPTPMLRALDKAITGPGQYSFEERMGCGFGACMGCTCETKAGPKRVCRDGPVFSREEVFL